MNVFKQILLKGRKALIPGRNRRLAFGVVSGVFIKAMALIFTLITVPMTLNYLGVEGYGVWVTMISMLAWVSLVDVGVANGVAPLLTSAFGCGRIDLAREYIATAFWSLIISCVAAGAVFFSFFDFVDWGVVFNIKSHALVAQVSAAMSVAVCIFLANIPLGINQRIYLASQNGAVANVWQLLTGIAGLVGFYCATRSHGGLVYLVLGYLGAQFLVGLANSVWLFGWLRPDLRPFLFPRFEHVKPVMAMGGMFFVNQVATLIMFQKDTVLISHYLGADQAARYSVIWQIFFYFNTINLLIAPYLGPAFGDAFAKKDLRWMRVAAVRYLSVTFGVAIFGVVFLAFFYKQILSLWVGVDVLPTRGTVMWMSIWTVVLSIQWPIISLLNGVGRLRVVTLLYLLAAVLNIFLSIFLIKAVGVSGGVVASVLSILTIVLFPSARELILVVKGR